MSPATMERLEQAPTLRQPEQGPVEFFDIMLDGHAIEKNPEAFATLAIPASEAKLLQDSSVTVAMLEGETPEDPPTFVLLASEKTDAPVTAEDQEAVIELLKDGNFIAPADNDSEASASESETTEDRTGKNVLQSLKRSKVGMLATAAIAALSLSHAQEAQANPDSVIQTNQPALSGSTFLSELDPTAADTDLTSADREALEQYCTKIALTKPKVVRALVLNAGHYAPEPMQRFSLSTRYRQHWPQECEGLYARSNRAKAQAWHNGHWEDVTFWSNVRIIPHSDPFLDGGNWFDLGNELNVDYPICNARILLKAGVVDLSVDKNMDIPWKPHHATVASTQFAPIRAALKPHKPKAC